MHRAPDIDPRLSKGATKLRKRKLDNIPWSHSGRHPGNSLFWRVILVMNAIAWRYIFRNRQVDELSDYKGGRIFSAMHINGLVDPMTLTYVQDRRIISMGRHDIMTMPLIGWFARRMGSQPVIRRPEIRNGVADEDYAKRINERTLLTMTSCIASGYNALVMPEGKSHQDSSPHRFKTGPMRFAVNAAALAKHNDLASPALQPVGLHYRCHYWFRTDIFVEFSEPIVVSPPMDKQIGEAISSGSWVEPPEEQVNQLRDRLFEAVSEVTPNSPSWEVYRAWHLIGHLEAQDSGNKLATLRDEVLAARRVRNSLLNREGVEQIMEPAEKAAGILHSNDLDGRSIIEGKLRSDRNWGKAIVGLTMMLLTSPVTLPSTGLQASLARYFGDRTDEGIDARTTYHMLAAMFSPILFWPPIAILATLTVSKLSMISIIIFLLIMGGIHISNLIFLFGYDLFTDFADSNRRHKINKSEQGEELRKLLDQIRLNLNLL